MLNTPPPPVHPQSGARDHATEALKQARDAIDRADQAVRDAMPAAVAFEHEIYGDSPHPIAALVSARESIAAARRGLTVFLDHGLDAPPMLRLAMAQQAEAYRGPR